MNKIRVIVPPPVEVPRGALWAESVIEAVHGWLKRVGERRGRLSLLNLARSVESSNPAFASELRAAAARMAR